jgi:dolichol-phosphate mannosyltransferase
MNKALVIVPTFNEASTIAEVARRLVVAAGDRVDLLVVDDNSPDGTADIVRSLPEKVHVLQRDSKRGLASAYIEGFAWARARGYSVVLEMDADLSHDPADVPRLLDALDNADLVIGSRYVEGGGVRNWGLLRRALSRSGNLYARLWLGFSVRDSTSGFRAYHVPYLKHAEVDTVRSEGYAFQIELTRRLFRRGARIVEIPITFTERTEGRSKMTTRIALEALWRVGAWGFRDRVLGRR